MPSNFTLGGHRGAGVDCCHHYWYVPSSIVQYYYHYQCSYVISDTILYQGAPIQEGGQGRKVSILFG